MPTLAKTLKGTRYVSRSRLLMICLLALLVLPNATMGVASSILQSINCDGVDSYVRDLQSVRDQIEHPVPSLDLDEVDSWSTDDLSAASAAITALRVEREQVQPPAVLEEFDTALNQFLGTVAQMFKSIDQAGIIGALAYSDSMEELGAELAAASLPAEIACNVAIYDHDEDGIVEIGPGSVGALSASTSGLLGTPTALGTRDDPFPIGTAVRISNDWEITVLGVVPDATNAVLDESQWNDPPDSGRRFFIARVSVLYTGQDASEFGARYRLSAVGSSAVSYTISDDDCGVIPNELEDPVVFEGGRVEGNICWSVRDEDASSLVMYDDDADSSDWVFLSLIPEKPEHLLSIGNSAPSQPASPDAGESVESLESTPIATPEIVPYAPGTPESTSNATPEVVAASPTAASPDLSSTPLAIGDLELDAKDIFFQPTELTIEAEDAPVTIKMTNTGAAHHNFSIDALDIDVDVNPGETVDIVIPAGTAPGTYAFYCDVPGHKEAGMVGTLTVEGPEGSFPSPDVFSTPLAIGEGELELEALDIAFVPTELTIQAADEPATIKMTNTGAALHNFHIDALAIDVDVSPGETVDIIIPAGTPPGTYAFYCDVPGHEEAGMVGTLTVEGPEGDAVSTATAEIVPEESPTGVQSGSYSIGDQIVVDHWNITVTEAVVAESIDAGQVLDARGTFVIVRMSVTNTSNTSDTFPFYSEFKLVTGDGRIYDWNPEATISTAIVDYGISIYDDLQPGLTYETAIAFDIAPDASSLTLQLPTMGGITVDLGI